jgi:hypothetical protein
MMMANADAALQPSNPKGSAHGINSSTTQSSTPDDLIQSMSALSMSASEDLDPSIYWTNFKRDFREWFDDAPDQEGPSSNPTGSTHGTAPLTPKIINSSITQSPTLNWTRSVPLASNPASQSQPNPSDLTPNFMSSDFIQSMAALEDLDPSMFRTDFERDFREWFDLTGVDL